MIDSRSLYGQSQQQITIQEELADSS